METGTHGSVGEGRGVIPALDSNNGVTFETNRRAFKSQLEACHALINQVPSRPRNELFHALGVFCFTTKAELVGDVVKSWCCRVVSYKRPTIENWKDYFVGYTQFKDEAWSALEPGQKIDVLSPPALEEGAHEMAALLPGDELNNVEPSYQQQMAARGSLSARQALSESYDASRRTVTLEESDSDVGF